MRDAYKISLRKHKGRDNLGDQGTDERPETDPAE
jgi:hypothetical protein